MKKRKLDIASWSYDRTCPLADGAVKIVGADAVFHTAGAMRPPSLRQSRRLRGGGGLLTSITDRSPNVRAAKGLRQRTSFKI